MKKLRSLLKELPKTEIHLHLEALASVDTIWQLMKRHDIRHPGIKSKNDLRRKFEVKSLNEFIDLFINVIQSCFKENDDLDLLMRDAKNYLTRNNIVYAEIFFAPTKLVMNGLPFADMVRKLDLGAKSIKASTGIDIRFIIDVSRSFGPENAEKNLTYTLESKVDTVIGIGLGGAEELGPARDYQAVFERAAANGLHVVAHAGEDVGPQSIWDALRLLKVSRIGHGISAVQDDELMSYLAEKQIPLEVCPTSNLFTRKYVDKLQNHPIRAFFDKGLCVTVNTDDPTLFNIDLIDEYMKLYDAELFDAGEILRLVKNGIYATFLPKERKDRIWEQAERIIAKRGYRLA